MVINHIPAKSRPRKNPGYSLVYIYLGLIFVIASIVDFLWTSLFFHLRDELRHGALPPHFWQAGALHGARVYWVVGLCTTLLAATCWLLLTP